MKLFSKIKRIALDSKPLRLAVNCSIVFLLVLLFVQCGLYIARYTNIRRSETKELFDMRMLTTSTQESLLSIDADILVPTSITIRQGTNCRTVLSSPVMINELLDTINPIVSEALNGSLSPTAYSVWIDVIEQKDGVYLKYANEFPYQVIQAYAASHTNNETWNRNGDIYIGISELFLTTDIRGTIDSLYVYGQSGVYLLNINTDVTLSHFTDYFTDFSDLFLSSELRYNGTSVELQLTDRVLCRDLLVSSGVTSLLQSNDDHINLLLRILNYNPDKLNSHTEPDGTKVFVESHGIFMINDLQINYIALDNGGISISALINEDKSSDIYSYLTFASVLFHRLKQMDQQYVGGDADISLQSISAQDKIITLTFSYKYDNIPIRIKGYNSICTLSFADNKLINFELNMISVGKTAKTQYILQQEFCESYLYPDTDSVSQLIYYAEELGVSTVSATWDVRENKNGAREGRSWVWAGIN